MSKKTPWIVGNWKLNPNNLKTATTLATEVVRKCKQSEATVAIAPPFVYLSEVGKKIAKSKVALAAQDMSTEPLGAFTGEISAAQLKDLGVTHVIIGHSERRAKGETDAAVVKKVELALKHKLIPIVCVGEATRDQHGNFYSFVESQIKALTGVLSSVEIKKVVLAYEPIWAIGTGDTATEDDVKEMQLFIYSTLTKAYDRKVAASVRLLYGGSVKPQNAKILHTSGGMNGFLVGGASLKATDFSEIIKATE